MKKAHILANGEFPRSPHLLKILQTADFWICCDGAANECYRRGLQPHAVVGDCDSLLPEVATAFADRLHRISEQETNDLSKAFHHALQLGYTDLTILGATGLREDHFLGNFALLMDYEAELYATGQAYQLRMLSDYGTFLPCRHNIELQVKVGQQISIFNFGAQHLRSVGLQYELYDINKLWQGTLNRAAQEQVRITAEGCFMVYVVT